MFEFDLRWKADKVAENLQAHENRNREQKLRNRLDAIDEAARTDRLKQGPMVRRPGGIPAARLAERTRLHSQAIGRGETLNVPAASNPARKSDRLLYPTYNFETEVDDDC